MENSCRSGNEPALHAAFLPIPAQVGTIFRALFCFDFDEGEKMRRMSENDSPDDLQTFAAYPMTKARGLRGGFRSFFMSQLAGCDVFTVGLRRQMYPQSLHHDQRRFQCWIAGLAE